jgi:hypothetical protein
MITKFLFIQFYFIFQHFFFVSRRPELFSTFFYKKKKYTFEKFFNAFEKKNKLLTFSLIFCSVEYIMMRIDKHTKKTRGSFAFFQNNQKKLKDTHQKATEIQAKIEKKII